MLEKNKTVKNVQHYFEVSYIQDRNEEFSLKCHIHMYWETIFSKFGGNDRE